MDDEKKKLTALEKAAKEAVRKQMAKEAAQLAKAAEQFPAVEGAPEELPADEVEAPAIAPPTQSQEIAAQQPAPIPQQAPPSEPAPPTQEGQPEPAPEQLAPEQLAAQQGVSPEYVANAGKQIDDTMLRRLILAHNGATDQQEATLQGLRRSMPTPDLRAPMAFLDSAIGTDVAKHMPAQLTDEERQLKYAGLESLIAKEKAAGVKNIIDYFKSQQSGGKYGDMAQTKMRGQDIGVQRELQSDLSKHFIEPLAGAQESLMSIRSNLQRGDLQGLEDALGTYAKFIQKQTGVLSDSDMARVNPKSMQLTLAKAEAYLKGDKNIDINTEVIAPMLRGVDIAEENTQQAYLQKLGAKKAVWEGRLGEEGVKSARMREMFAPVETTVQAFRKATPAKKTAGPKKEAGPAKDLAAAAAAELARRRGGK